MTTRTVVSAGMGGIAALVLCVGGAIAGDTEPVSEDILATDDVLASMDSISGDELSTLNGGTSIGDVAVNWALTQQSVEGDISGGETGVISNNTVANTKGITSLMYNTGNNVNFSSNMQINVYMK